MPELEATTIHAAKTYVSKVSKEVMGTFSLRRESKESSVSHPAGLVLEASGPLLLGSLSAGVLSQVITAQPWPDSASS